MPTPTLRNPYASHAKITPKATSSFRVITPSCLKKKLSSFAGPNPTISSHCRRHQPATWEASEIAQKRRNAARRPPWVMGSSAVSPASQKKWCYHEKTGNFT